MSAEEELMRFSQQWDEAMVYGDTVVVTSRGTSAGKYLNQSFEFYEQAAPGHQKIN
jgi:hypothetical protein